MDSGNEDIEEDVWDEIVNDLDREVADDSTGSEWEKRMDEELSEKKYKIAEGKSRVSGGREGFKKDEVHDDDTATTKNQTEEGKKQPARAPSADGEKELGPEVQAANWDEGEMDSAQGPSAGKVDSKPTVLQDSGSSERKAKQGLDGSNGAGKSVELTASLHSDVDRHYDDFANASSGGMGVTKQGAPIGGKNDFSRTSSQACEFRRTPSQASESKRTPSQASEFKRTSSEFKRMSSQANEFPRTPSESIANERERERARRKQAAGEVFDVMDLDDTGVAMRQDVDEYLKDVCGMNSNSIEEVWNDVWKEQPESDELLRQKFIDAAFKMEWPIGLEEVEAKQNVPHAKPLATLEVTVVRASNLPKADVFGTIDPYFFVSVAGKQQRTNKKMNEPNPYYDETFGFSVPERPGELSFELWDYDRTSKDDKVGEAFVSGADIEKLLQRESGALLDLNLPIFKLGGGNQLHSPRGGPSTVNVIVRMHREAHEVKEASDEADHGSLLLLCKVKGAASLPKTDILGKTDAYVVLKYMGQEARTKTIKYSYEPVWDETFGFRVPPGWMNVSPVILGDKEESLVATVFDWDRFGKDQKIGVIRVSTHEMVGLLSKERKVTVTKPLLRKAQEGGSFVSRSMSLVNLTSKSLNVTTEETIEGDDNHISTLTLQFTANLAGKFEVWYMRKSEQKRAFRNKAVEAQRTAEEVPKKVIVRRSSADVKDWSKQKVDGSWWETHPPQAERDEVGLILGLECVPVLGQRVVEVSVARSGGAAGTVVGVTNLPVRPLQPTFLPLGRHTSIGDLINTLGGKNVHKLARSYDSWVVCVEWDHGTSHVYHADRDNRFNLRLLGGWRRNATQWASELTAETEVELSQEGRDWYRHNSPATVGLPGRGLISRTFGNNCEVFWMDSCMSMRVPNRFLRPRNSKSISMKQVEAPVVSQTKISTGAYDTAIITIRCGTEGATIRYTLDRPSAPGLHASGTASHTMPGHPGWKIYNGELRIPLQILGGDTDVHDLLLKASATRRGCKESKVVGWIVQRGSPARWEQHSPLWSTPMNVYHFDTPSKFTSWPRPQSAHTRLRSSSMRASLSRPR